MAEQMIHVIIVEPEEEAAGTLREVLSRVEDIGVAHVVDDVLQAHERGYEHDIRVYILGRGVDEPFASAERLLGRLPGAGVLLVADEAGAGLYRRAMQTGIRDVLTEPLAPLPVADTIYRTYDSVKDQPLSGREIAKDESRRDSGSRQGPGAAVWTVFGTKGGVGKTTIATNLAVSLASMTDQEVILWDLDLQFGNAGLFLDLSERRPLRDLVSEIHTLDGELLETFLVRHTSGVRLLPSCTNPEFAEYVSEDHVTSVLEVMKGMCDIIVVDSPAGFSDPILGALDNSDRILLVGNPDLATLYNLKSSVSVLQSLHYNRDEIKLVLNRATEGYGIRPSDAETTLEMNIYSQIPADGRRAIGAVNKGVPFCYSEPRAKISKSIRRMARRLAEQGNGGGLLGSLFGGGDDNQEDQDEGGDR